MDSVKTLIGQYVPPQQAKMEAAMKAGNFAVSPNPSTGAVSLAISNYTQQGDKMTITLGAANSELRGVNIATWQGDASHPVTLVVTYANLGNGVDYAQSTVLNATGDKKINLTVTGTNYSLAP